MAKWVPVTQSHPTIGNSMDCSPPGSSVHGILQARRLEWVVIPFSRASSQPRDQTGVSCTAGRVFTISNTKETLMWRSPNVIQCNQWWVHQWGIVPEKIKRVRPVGRVAKINVGTWEIQTIGCERGTRMCCTAWAI